MVRTSCNKKIRFNIMGIKEFLVKLGFYKTRFLMIFLGVLCKKGENYNVIFRTSLEVILMIALYIYTVNYFFVKFKN
jgi:hypothetical protein